MTKKNNDKSFSASQADPPEVTSGASTGPSGCDCGDCDCTSLSSSEVKIGDVKGVKSA